MTKIIKNSNYVNTVISRISVLIRWVGNDICVRKLKVDMRNERMGVNYF